MSHYLDENGVTYLWSKIKGMFAAKTEKRFKEYYHKYKEYYDTIDSQEKNQIIMGIKNRMFQEGLMMESITFNDWIQEIEKL